VTEKQVEYSLTDDSGWVVAILSRLTHGRQPTWCLGQRSRSILGPAKRNRLLRLAESHSTSPLLLRRP
jgi:hypothetical protein